MQNVRNLLLAGLRALALLVCVIGSATAQGTVGKWERTVISVQEAGYSGNPFELVVDATFTNSNSNTVITLPAYYAGNDTWKVGFMPPEIGTWQYAFTSTFSPIAAYSGTVEAVDSDNDGLLSADPQNPRKWKLSDGPYILPIALRMEFFFEEGTDAEWAVAADFLKNEVGAHLYDTRLQDEFSGSMDVFSGDPANHQFDLAKWDQMERRMDALAERGLGAYLMFYADDTGEPQWSGKSATEALLIRYTVARLAGYPILMWDTGIDIAEYRTQSDIDWFGQELRRVDPYGHPVSSRIGGGSGTLYMSGRTYDSQGDRQAYIDDMISYFQNTSRPVAMADSYHEDHPERPEKDFRPEDIRRAMWKGVMSGGLSIFIRGSDGYFHIDSIVSDLESESWIRLVNPFIVEKLGDTYGRMVPEAGLVSNGYALADPDRLKILYWTIGANDRYDAGDGGDVTLELSGVSGSYTAVWFDPRTGAETSAGSFDGGSTHVVSPPSTDDWVLLLTREGTVKTPKPPTDLTVSE